MLNKKVCESINNNRDFSNAFRSLHAMKAKKAELEKQIKELQGQLTATMQELGLVEVTAGGFTGKYSTYTTTRLDTAKLKESNPEIYRQYSKEDTVTRFSLKQ